MNVLIFEWKNFGIEDICDALTQLGHTYKCNQTELIHERVCPEFDRLFEKETESAHYDCVFTFNYSPVISNNCSKRNIPYISFIYDSPLVSLYSYTIINPCNYVFIFDRAQYFDLKKEGINTVYYTPLAVNTDRLNKQTGKLNGFNCDVSFVGSMYNEKHNLFERFKNLPAFVQGYLDAIMQAQLKVYGYFFIEELLTENIINELQKSVPVSPNKDGVETVSYIYAYYFIARKLAEMERHDLLSAVSEHFDTYLYTPNPTPALPHIKNMGAIDYYNDMPGIFKKSKINLNISLRSIREGIPLRAMDILGSGGFLLSNYQSGFFDVFTPGEDMVLFESKDDLINKCAYYLKHEKERMQIATNGHGIIEERHTYKVRLNEIFDIVFL